MEESMNTVRNAQPSHIYPQSASYLTTRRDARFAKGLLDQSVALFLGGEPEAARLVLRDLVSATVGFEMLAALTNMSAKSLRGMLTCHGRLGMDGLSTIFSAIRDWLQVTLEVQVVDAV
jgi:hypothetical protein